MMPKFLGACCVLLMLSCSLLAQGKPEKKDPPKPPNPTIDLNKTPLDGAIEKLNTKINQKLEVKKVNDKDCNDAAEEVPDPNDPKGKHKKAKNVAAKCHLMQTKLEEDLQEDSELKNVHKRRIGRKLKKVHTLYLEHPRDRFLEDPPQLSKWDKITYTGRPSIDLAGVARSGVKAGPSSIRIRNAMLPGSNSVNDDFDCVDLATNTHIAGVVKDELGNITDYPCFADFTSKVLKSTLVLQDDGTYAHESGRVYSAAEYNELPATAIDADGNPVAHTTLQELIDEDSNIGDSLNLDEDGDSLFGEDPPSADPTNTVCHKMKGAPNPDPNNPDAESCDFTKAIQDELQDRGKKQNGNAGKKYFKMDENGNCSTDPDAPGDYFCGEEPREIQIEETLALRCPPNAEYVEDTPDPEHPELKKPGLCKMPNENLYLTAAYGAENAFSDITSTSPYAMMGFTFAPPVLEWGINESWRVCVFGFCWEVFGIRFGYEFDVAAGLRMPVKVDVQDVPTQVIAEDTVSLPVSITPEDFRVSDYTNFCRQHNLDRNWWISDCDRFSFPEYFASMLPDSWFGPEGKQGSEFVAHTSIFAGLQVRVFSIPVVNYAIDSSVNVPAMCTLNKMKGNITDWLPLLVSFGSDLAKSKSLIESLEGSLDNCSSFTTPYGNDEDGNPRQFPFLTDFEIPANCLDAKLDPTTIAVGGESKPNCTGLLLNIYGATLGIGLKLTPIANSRLIGVDVSASGDAEMVADTLDFEFGKPNPIIQNVKFENYDKTTKSATIALDDFTYYLNYFGVKIEGLVQLGGILSFIGNVGSIPLVEVGITTGHVALPIPQHPGTGPVTLVIPVTNYALSVDGRPNDDDPMRADVDTLRIKPGTQGAFEVRVRNEGTDTDTIDNFKFTLSNRPLTGANLGVLFSHNNDFDCKDDVTGAHYFGYPYDGLADDCYDAAGNPLVGRTEQINEDGVGDSKTGDGSAIDRDKDGDGLADEDPAGDDWIASFAVTSVGNVAAETIVNNANSLSVIPFQHPLTRPGDYPVKIQADSQSARTRGLHSPDKSGLARLAAEDVVNVRIESFFDPQVVVLPAANTVKPGGQVTYQVEALNGGNQDDQIAMLATFADSDTAACTLTTNGLGPACPYRALVTRIDPALWTTVAELDTFFPPAGKYVPLGNGRDSFTITAPADWAGMQDTVYDFTLTATSTVDTRNPKAHNEFLGHFTITATKQSMSRYLNLEIAEFLAEVEKAKAAGLQTKGIQPVMLHPVTMMTSKALEQILAGDLASASKTLSSATKVMEAVARMVSSAGLADPYATDWNARASAILADMAKTEASMAQ